MSTSRNVRSWRETGKGIGKFGIFFVCQTSLIKFQAQEYGLKGWSSLQSYLGYDATNKAIKNETQFESRETVGQYGGLSKDADVNPFQEAIAKQNQENGYSDNSGWNSENWGSNAESAEDWGGDNKYVDDWNNTDWGDSPKKTQKTVSANPKQTKTTKVTKKDSFGNDMDAWENWLNDDSSPVASTKKTHSPQPTKKGD